MLFTPNEKSLQIPDFFLTFELVRIYFQEKVFFSCNILAEISLNISSIYTNIILRCSVALRKLVTNR